MKRLLLHVCCAPCSTVPRQRLAEEGFEVSLFYYNPNLHPRPEHELRAGEARRYAREAGLGFSAPEPDFEGWEKATRGHETDPEGGARCELCFAFRLDETARAARRGGFDAFASTLSLSPHKKTAQIDTAGKNASRKHGVAYVATDFKKKDGFGQSVRISREHGLYRQDYCGCRHSLRSSSTR